jgi:hypothetical protein
VKQPWTLQGAAVMAGRGAHRELHVGVALGLGPGGQHALLDQGAEQRGHVLLDRRQPGVLLVVLFRIREQLLRPLLEECFWVLPYLRSHAMVIQLRSKLAAETGTKIAQGWAKLQDLAQHFD